MDFESTSASEMMMKEESLSSAQERQRPLVILHGGRTQSGDGSACSEVSTPSLSPTFTTSLSTPLPLSPFLDSMVR